MEHCLPVLHDKVAAHGHVVRICMAVVEDGYFAGVTQMPQWTQPNGICSQRSNGPRDVIRRGPTGGLQRVANQSDYSSSADRPASRGVEYTVVSGSSRRGRNLLQ